MADVYNWLFIHMYNHKYINIFTHLQLTSILVYKACNTAYNNQP